MSAGLGYWIGLGANIGDRWDGLRRAVDAIAAAGAPIEACSSAYETAPRERIDQPAFLNAVVRARSPLTPPELLAAVKRIERDLGRDPGGPRFGPRVIDCDLLMWEGGGWEAPDLQIPHPRLAERRFALVPLIELDPHLVLPGGATVTEAEARLDAADQDVRRARDPRWPPPAPRA
ncbi:MAG: 2-amino-4-hydroxy-6-hydroxymethyldihydropteridine diphosphokinase [Miltoncostaeaceae bacterium]